MGRWLLQVDLGEIAMIWRRLRNPESGSWGMNYDQSTASRLCRAYSWGEDETAYPGELGTIQKTTTFYYQTYCWRGRSDESVSWGRNRSFSSAENYRLVRDSDGSTVRSVSHEA